MSGYQLPLGLIADNDGIFGKWLEPDFQRYFDMAVGRSPPGQPWCNRICERFHRSLKSEVLNRVGHQDVAQMLNNEIRYAKTVEVDGLITSFKLVA
jgi:hypothetical protein